MGSQWPLVDQTRGGYSDTTSGIALRKEGLHAIYSVPVKQEVYIYVLKKIHKGNMNCFVCFVNT